MDLEELIKETKEKLEDIEIWNLKIKRWCSLSEEDIKEREYYKGILEQLWRLKDL